MGAKSRRAAAEGRAPERGAGGGPRYATREGWRFGRLVVTLFVAVAGVVLLGSLAAWTTGTGLSDGICAEITVHRSGSAVQGRPDLLPPLQTMGTLGQDSEPGKSSTVRLKDSLGEYEVKYTVPDGCPPGGTVKFFHYH